MDQFQNSYKHSLKAEPAGDSVNIARFFLPAQIVNLSLAYFWKEEKLESEKSVSPAAIYFLTQKKLNKLLLFYLLDENVS